MLQIVIALLQVVVQARFLTSGASQVGGTLRLHEWFNQLEGEGDVLRLRGVRVQEGHTVALILRGRVHVELVEQLVLTLLKEYLLVFPHEKLNSQR